MPRSAARNEAMRAATHEAVLTAAVRLFARHGFAATNMRDIAREAGVSTGLIYQHHASKNELFTEVVTRAADGLFATARILTGDGDAASVLYDFTRRFLADIATDKDAAEFFMVVNQGFLADEPPGVRDRLRPGHQAFRQALTEVIRRGQRRGRFGDGDPAEMVICYLALLSGIVTTILAMPDEVSVPSPDAVLRVLTTGRTPTND